MFAAFLPFAPCSVTASPCLLASTMPFSKASRVGAVGWIAGLANALPGESVDLFDYGIQGKSSEAFELYRWFLPLLRLDTVPKFVQLIKLVQEELGVGNADVRPPKLRLTGEELQATKDLIHRRAPHTPAKSQHRTPAPSSGEITDTRDGNTW